MTGSLEAIFWELSYHIFIIENLTKRIPRCSASGLSCILQKRKPEHVICLYFNENGLLQCRQLDRRLEGLGKRRLSGKLKPHQNLQPRWGSMHLLPAPFFIWFTFEQRIMWTLHNCYTRHTLPLHYWNATFHFYFIFKTWVVLMFIISINYVV